MLKNKISELEARKLELEIKELERPLYKRAAFLSLLVPIIATIVTGLIGYWGNLEVKALNAEKESLTETAHQLVTDQQQLVTQYVGSIEDYIAYLSLVQEYRDNPKELLSKSGMQDAKARMDKWLVSQVDTAALSRDLAKKYEHLLGQEKANDLVNQSGNVEQMILGLREETDELFEQAMQEFEN